ncbi:putative quinol monooxygenase [Pontibacter ramchanderi]|nr:antibiotic biosynthesis monooxygenase family protein [Pontibacter ramchanderi]
MKKYGLHGKLQATTGNGPALAQLLLEASKMVSTAKGCRLYLISQEDTAPDDVWVTEVWDSKEDHDNSLQAPGVKELIAQAMPLLAGRPDKGQQLTVLGGAGLN